MTQVTPEYILNRVEGDAVASTTSEMPLGPLAPPRRRATAGAGVGAKYVASHGQLGL